MKCEVCGKRMSKKTWTDGKGECKECKQDLIAILNRELNPKK